MVETLQNFYSEAYRFISMFGIIIVLEEITTVFVSSFQMLDMGSKTNVSIP